MTLYMPCMYIWTYLGICLWLFMERILTEGDADSGNSYKLHTAFFIFVGIPCGYVYYIDLL